VVEQRLRPSVPDKLAPKYCTILKKYSVAAKRRPDDFRALYDFALVALLVEAMKSSR